MARRSFCLDGLGVCRPHCLIEPSGIRSEPYPVPIYNPPFSWLGQASGHQPWKWHSVFGDRIHAN